MNAFLLKHRSYLNCGAFMHFTAIHLHFTAIYTHCIHYMIKETQVMLDDPSNVRQFDLVSSEK